MTFFNEETMQRIRFLHYKIKSLENAFDREDEDFTLDDLNLILEYTMVLNINYENKNHKKILESELELTPMFHDPFENRDIEINDLMFECARVLWILARGYIRISERLEEEEEWDDSIVAMVECSKIYKAAAYFSGAAVQQDDKGKSLFPDFLELRSEEARGWAQSIAAVREEVNSNLYFASKLYAGLSILSKRIFYLKMHEEKRRQQIRAQFHFDMGKACQFKAQASLDSSIAGISKEKVKKLLQKAYFYYEKASDIWKSMLKNSKDLSKEEKDNVKINLSVVKEEIDELDVEILDYEDIKKIQDPEPVIIVPENLAPFVPKSVVYLTKFVPKDLNIKRFKEFQQKKLDKKIPYSRREKLLDKKSALLRTINELKSLKENREIDIDKYAELMEKYSTKLKMVDTAIEKLSK